MNWDSSRLAKVHLIGGQGLMEECPVSSEEDWSEEQDVHIDLKLTSCHEMALISTKLLIWFVLVTYQMQ